MKNITRLDALTYTTLGEFLGVAEMAADPEWNYSAEKATKRIIEIMREYDEQKKKLEVE